MILYYGLHNVIIKHQVNEVEGAYHVKKIFVVLFMLFSVKAYAGAYDLLRLDYTTAMVEDVQNAINNGADVNVQDEDGWTALTIAQAGGYMDIIEILKSAGAK